jgi:hypothetical protein
MLTADDLAEAEGIAARFLHDARIEADEVPSMDLLASRTIKSRVLTARLVGVEGDLSQLGDRWILRVHRLAHPARRGWIIGHELGHFWFREQAREPSDRAYLEAMCDAIGAALVIPRAAMKAARGHLGDRVASIAAVFETTRALTMLRIGEVTGRPVRLLGPRPRVRGELFEWGDGSPSQRRHVHPIRLSDERKWGLMRKL